MHRLQSLRKKRAADQPSTVDHDEPGKDLGRREDDASLRDYVMKLDERIRRDMDENQKTNQSLADQIKKLQDELRLKTAAENKNGANSSLQTTLQETQVELRALQDQNEARNAQLEHEHQEDLKNHAAIVAELEARLHTMQEQLEGELQRKKEQHQSDVEEWAQAAALSKEAVRRLEEDNRGAQEEMQHARQGVHDLQKELDATQKRNQELVEELARELKQEQAQRQSDKEESTRALSLAREEVRKLEEGNPTALEELCAVRQDLHGLQEELGDVEERNQELREQVERLTGELREEKEQRQLDVQAVASYKGEVGNLENEKRKVEEDILDMRMEKESLIVQRKRLDEKWEKAEKTYKMEIEKLVVAAKMSKVEKYTLQGKPIEEIGTAKSTKEQAEVWRKAAETPESELDERLKEMGESSKSRLKPLSRRLKQQLETARKDQAQVEQSLEKTKAANDQLKASLTAKTKDIQALVHGIAELLDRDSAQE